METLKIIDDSENINVENAIQYLNHLRGNQDLNATSMIVTKCAEDRSKYHYEIVITKQYYINFDFTLNT